MWYYSKCIRAKNNNYYYNFCTWGNIFLAAVWFDSMQFCVVKPLGSTLYTSFIKNYSVQAIYHLGNDLHRAAAGLFLLPGLSACLRLHPSVESGQVFAAFSVPVKSNLLTRPVEHVWLIYLKLLLSETIPVLSELMLGSSLNASILELCTCQNRRIKLHLSLFELSGTEALF